MRDYELVLLIKPEVTEDDLPTALEEVRQMIAERSGSVTEMTSWGRRKLAYPIAGAMEATYVLTRLQLEPGEVSRLEANLQLADKILRYLIVRAEGQRQVTAASVSGEDSKERGNGQSE